jgi:hypothetical protein
MSGCCSGRADVRVVIERLEIDAKTCDRCASTTEAAESAAREVASLLAEHGITLGLVEKTLAASGVADFNRVLVNERPVEEWLSGAVSMTDCPSCGDLIGESTCCRSYEIDGGVSESLSVEQVARAILLAAGLGHEERVSVGADKLDIVLVTGPGCG